MHDGASTTVDSLARARCICLVVGGVIGAARATGSPITKIPSFIVTLAGMLVFKGLSLAMLGGQSVGPFPTEFQLLSAGFIPDFIGPITDPAGVQRCTATTLLIGVVIVAAMLYFSLARPGQPRERTATRPNPSRSSSPRT